jgi:hypothetical protein
MNENQESRDEPTDPLWLAEFFCWTMVVLAPILSWVNGPSVSTDQFVVRTSDPSRRRAPDGDCHAERCARSVVLRLSAWTKPHQNRENWQAGDSPQAGRNAREGDAYTPAGVLDGQLSNRCSTLESTLQQASVPAIFPPL